MAGGSGTHSTIIEKCLEALNKCGYRGADQLSRQYQQRRHQTNPTDDRALLSYQTSPDKAEALRLRL